MSEYKVLHHLGLGLVAHHYLELCDLINWEDSLSPEHEIERCEVRCQVHIGVVSKANLGRPGFGQIPGVPSARQMLLTSRSVVESLPVSVRQWKGRARVVKSRKKRQ